MHGMKTYDYGAFHSAPGCEVILATDQGIAMVVCLTCRKMASVEHVAQVSAQSNYRGCFECCIAARGKENHAKHDSDGQGHGG